MFSTYTKKINLYDLFEYSLQTFSEGQMFEGYIGLRENINISILTDQDIVNILMGDVSVIWENDQFFFIIDKVNFKQKSAIQGLVDKYKNMILIDDNYFTILKSINYSMFESISPKRFQSNVIFSTSLIKSFVFGCVGDYFLIKDDKLHFIKREHLNGFNPFLN